MRKLPEGCPEIGYWCNKLNVLDHNEVEMRRYPTEPVELMPIGSRALLDEALKMVERIDTAWTRDFSQGPDGDYTYMRLSDETRETWNGIRALLAKAREGEG